MTIVMDIILSVVLITFGYVYTCYYFSERKLESIRAEKLDKELLKLNKNRLVYISFNVLVTISLISVFQMVFYLDLISQLRLLSLVLIMVPMAAVDFKVQKIPNQLLICGLMIRVVLLGIEMIISFNEGLDLLINGIIGALVIGIFFLVMFFVFRNSIGMGDIKLFSLMGLYQGIWGVVNSVFFSLLVSFFVSLFLLITKRKQRGDSIAFGPSILLGTIAAIALSGM